MSVNDNYHKKDTVYINSNHYLTLAGKRIQEMYTNTMRSYNPQKNVRGISSISINPPWPLAQLTITIRVRCISKNPHWPLAQLTKTISMVTFW